MMMNERKGRERRRRRKIEIIFGEFYEIEKEIIFSLL